MVLTGMSLIRKVAFIMFCLFLIMGICNTAYATIIHYSISGISYYWPSGLSYEEGGPDQPPSTEIVGDAYISSIGIGDSYRSWDIVSFALVIGEYGYGGFGELYSTEVGTGIRLYGSGTWVDDNSFWGTEQTYPNTLTELPDMYDFGSGDNSGWFGSYFSNGGWGPYTAISNDGEYYCRVDRFIITKVAPVPEPATMFLLGTGLISLAGFRKKLKK